MSAEHTPSTGGPSGPVHTPQHASSHGGEGGPILSRTTAKRPHDFLLDHEYDGIREFDNPTPGWWHIIFAGSIVFSLAYFLFFEVSIFGWTPQQSVAAAQAQAAKRLFADAGEVKPDEASILRLMADKQLMTYAQGTFATNCAACHARDGGGINGVNLTDDSYKVVRSLTDIFKVISEGANNGAMPAWKNNFSEKERVLLAAYVASLRGTTPASSKAPEGEVIPPWPTGGASQSAALRDAVRSGSLADASNGGQVR
jgi:cytochrome c oxidase cbb3-type subunit 3